MRNTPVKQSDMDILLAEVKQLREQVKVLQNQHSPTVPIYRPDFPDDAIQGQIALADNSNSALALFWRVVSGWLGPLLSFGFENAGTSLHIETTTGSFVFTADAGGFDLTTDTFISMWTSGTAFYRSDGDTTQDINGDWEVDTDGTAELFAGTSFQITAESVGITATVNDVQIQIGSGATFTILNHLGVPKIRWTEGTNDIHIPTGGTLVADL